MIDKATFEAHVRAEAEAEHPGAMPRFDAFHRSGIRIEDINWMIVQTKREAYIAARMEHEWRLVEAAQAVVLRWDSPLWKDVPHTGAFIGRLRDALYPYTTKPIER